MAIFFWVFLVASSLNQEFACTLKDIINFREISLASRSYLSRNHNYRLNDEQDGPLIHLSLCNKIDPNYLKGTNCSQDYFLVIDDGLKGCTGLKWKDLTQFHFNRDSNTYSASGVIKNTGKLTKIYFPSLVDVAKDSDLENTQ